jgi:hypothetical protein
MNLSVKELDALLKSNPDIAVVPDRIDERNLLPSDFAIRHGGYVVAASELDFVECYPGMPIRNEHELQVAVIAECQRCAETNPVWEMIFAIPNGGKRDKATAGKLKAEGLKKGIPDLMIPLARMKGNVHRNGLYLEVKWDKNTLSESQEWWFRRLRIEGYVCEVAYTFEEAMNTLTWWIEG